MSEKNPESPRPGQAFGAGAMSAPFSVFDSRERRMYNPANMARRSFALFVIFFLTSAAGSVSCLPITIGVPVQEQGVITTQSWALLCGRLMAETGLEIRSVVLKDHRAVMDELRSRFIDIAVVDPAWYDREERILTPLLQARASPRTADGICLIVPRGSIFYKPADLDGRSIALTRAGQSAAGYFVPLAVLAEAGVVYTDPRHIIFAETFDSILKGVAFGSLEAGVVPSYELEAGKGTAYMDFIRVIAVSSPLPHPLLVGRRDDDAPSRYNAVIRGFLGLSGTESGRRTLLEAGYAEFCLPSRVGFDALERYLRIFRDAYGAPE
jgi:ABC-type phosphate/phosphonate transport system substrate-binding protein